MYFLAPHEARQWRANARDILTHTLAPPAYVAEVRPALRAAFHFHVGTFCAAHEQLDNALAWLRAGALREDDLLLSNGFLASFLERHHRLVMPAVVFADPQPYLHFISTPPIQATRANFIASAVTSLPALDHPLRIMDIGTGDGSLLVELLTAAKAKGTLCDIGEILLIDASPAMIAHATKTLAGAFPATSIRTITARFEQAAAQLDARYDVALSSLAYHHMPYEKKARHLRELKPWIDHFIIMEFDANHDTPELYAPELALSLYQSYGRAMDFVFSHDAPVEVALASVDSFLMGETVSFLTQPRGVRTDYHMLRRQWHALFHEVLGPEFTCWNEATCYSDQYFDMFTLHYGRDVQRR